MQVHKLKQHQVESIAGSANIPLLETTNQQHATHVTAAVSGGGSSAKQQPGCASGPIDLSSDSPQPAKSLRPASAATAAATATDEAAQQEQQQQAISEQPEQPKQAATDAMEVDGDAPPASSAAAAEAAGVAGTEPATPAVKKAAAAGAATPGSALNTSTAKVPAEAFLTPAQRQQLLEACLEVRVLVVCCLTQCRVLKKTHAEAHAAGLQLGCAHALCWYDGVLDWGLPGSLMTPLLDWF
jgi:hypothetical protein